MSKEAENINYKDLLTKIQTEENSLDWHGNLPERWDDEPVDYLAVSKEWAKELKRRGWAQ